MGDGRAAPPPHRRGGALYDSYRDPNPGRVKVTSSSRSPSAPSPRRTWATR
ncbi:hypothetical protein NKH77_13195 [Streptomyces sp. M19]